MRTISTCADMSSESARLRREGKRIGFVPTMGYLHKGHMSLVRASRISTDVTVTSIFVNPTQFGPGEDFERYPRNLARDSEMLLAEGCEYVFAPPTSEMYEPGARTFVEVTELQDPLCGRSRPGHFRGVATVVAKLFNIVQPHRAFFGQKDAQQSILIRRMAEDLRIPVEVVVCPIIREPDGLAMSSRNTYLTPDERRQAVALFRGLREARAMFDGGERIAAKLADRIRSVISESPLARTDYIEIVDATTLKPVDRADAPALVALAVRFSSTRLIDNMILEGGRK